MRDRLRTAAAIAGVFGLGLLAGGCGGGGSEGDRDQTAANLEFVNEGMHNYASYFGKLPAYGFGGEGEPLLSWRVDLVGRLKDQSLRKKFDTTKRWDDPANLPLLDERPSFYAAPGSGNDDPTKTPFRVIATPAGVSPSSLFRLAEPGKAPPRSRLRSAQDGTSNTIMIVQAAEAVPWTEPAPLIFDPEGSVPNFGYTHAGKTVIGMADGRVYFMDQSVDPEVVKALITANGNEDAATDLLSQVPKE